MLGRDSFHSRLGFVLAAAGSAVGLGNIWGFPTQVASNGGGAFLLVYLIVTLLLALPALITELYIGYHAKANPVEALSEATSGVSRKLGAAGGYFGMAGALMMLSFYSIVAGWMVSHALAFIAQIIENQPLSDWFVSHSTLRNFVFTPLFIAVTGLIIAKGVSEGIEKWSRRFMPVLLAMLIGLLIYIAMQEGAAEGFRTYLSPDLSKVTDPDLIIAAMGQAFFSLSIGVGGMMVYGSYLKPNENLFKLGGSVALLDTFIAFLAGLLIIPAMFVAKHNGVQIYDNGKLIAEDRLIFDVLPDLFMRMGDVGLYVGFAFFVLMSIAALTSTISSTEVPVSYLVEAKGMQRKKATLGISIVVLVASSTIIMNFGTLFMLVVNWVSRYQLPLMGLFYLIVVGWVWKRGNHLVGQEAKGAVRYLGMYLKWVCPLLLTLVFLNVIR